MLKQTSELPKIFILFTTHIIMKKFATPSTEMASLNISFERISKFRFETLF